VDTTSPFPTPIVENDRQTEGAEVGLGIQHHASGEDGDDDGDAENQNPELTPSGNKTTNGLPASITSRPPQNDEVPTRSQPSLTHSPPSPPAARHRKKRGSVAD
jgi:hypothetical protein